MTKLTITPKWADKTARFNGVVAAGESVSVTVKGGAEWTAGGGLRLRVVGLRGETLAQFPPEVEIEDESATPDLWGADGDDATCTLNLRTDAMMRAVPPGATMPFLFVLDDVTDDGETLYFKDLCEVAHWPQRTGEDNPPPYAMRGYRDFVKDVLNRVDAVETQIGNITLRAERFAETESGAARNGVEITIWDGAEGSEPAVVKLYDGEVSLAQMNAVIASAIAAKADKTAFESHASNTTLHITAAERSTWNAKYKKPSTGIPKNDLAAAVQASLGKADTALQAHQDISMKADRTEVEAALATKANWTALNAESTARANAVAALQDALDTLTDSDAGYSVRQIAAMEVAKVVAGADASFDTLKEIADWIANDTTGAAKMANDISALQSGKVDKENGKGLSTNDYTTSEKEKLGGIEADANKTVVDATLDGSSTNPVQNKVVKTELDTKLSVTEAAAGFMEWTVSAELYEQGEEQIGDFSISYLGDGWLLQGYIDGNLVSHAVPGDKDLANVQLVTSYNGKRLVISAFREKLRPTRTSELTNDSGFLTQHQDISGKADVSVPVAKTLTVPEVFEFDGTYTTGRPFATQDGKVRWEFSGGSAVLRVEYDPETDTFRGGVEDEGLDVYAEGLAEVVALAREGGGTLTKSESGTAAYAPDFYGTATVVVSVPDPVARRSDLAGKEDASNKVASLSAQSTDVQYPTAKCVWDMVGDVEAALAAINGTENGGSGT